MPERVMDIVDRVIGKEKRPYSAEHVDFVEPRAVRKNYTERVMPVGKPIFCIGIKDCDIPQSPAMRYKKSEAMNILLNMIFSEAGDFYLEMLESGLLSPGFDSGYSSNSKTAYVMMSGESDDPELLLEKIKEQIAKARNQGLSRKDFEREKKCHYYSYVSDFDMTEDIAFALTAYACDDIDIFTYPEIIADVTFEYVTQLLNESFADESFSLSVVKPEK
jgi:predicted Zn-dependent peptidase